MERPFLTARWVHLAMANYAVDPDLLAPYVPRFAELDFHNGRTFVSIVGFRFLGTRVMGVAIPFHRNFEEVNLRFYVRRRVDGDWRRGVVFVREIVPRAAIAFVARHCYGEPYVHLPTRYRIDRTASSLTAEYRWRRNGAWESLRVETDGPLHPLGAGSLEEFIAEHSWGYTQRGNHTNEYEVAHPRWSIWPGRTATLDCDAATLYGEGFAGVLRQQPVSSFVADGSEVCVGRKVVLKGP